jgi:cytochrome c
MFDTMTMTKIVGGLCGMFLIFLLGSWAAESMYDIAVYGEEGHGEEAPQAYVIDTGEEEAEEEEVAEETVDFGVVLAAADVASGEKLFKGCKSCHKVEKGKNGVGPSLFGVVGRAVGSSEGFKYSGNLVAVAETWGPEELNAFLENPKAFAPGTKMSYKGMSDIEDRANLIVWLDSLDD